MDDAALCQVVYAPLTPPCDDERKTDFLLQANYFLRELGRTGVTRLLLWREYRQRYPEGYGYTRFCIPQGSRIK